MNLDIYKVDPESIYVKIRVWLVSDFISSTNQCEVQISKNIMLSNFCTRKFDWLVNN